MAMTLGLIYNPFN